MMNTQEKIIDYFFKNNALYYSWRQEKKFWLQRKKQDIKFSSYWKSRLHSDTTKKWIGIQECCKAESLSSTRNKKTW